MRQKSNSTPASSETLVRNIRRATRKHRGRREDPHCARWPARRDLNRRALPVRRHRREHVLFYWSKEFLEAGKRRLAGDTARAALVPLQTPIQSLARSPLSSGLNRRI